MILTDPRTLVAVALVTAGLLSGCASPCAPQEVPTVVTLALLDEEVRTLPILVSGATQVAGQSLPDAHGRLAVSLSVEHPGNANVSLDFQDVDVRSLRLDVQAGDRTIPVRLLRVEGGSSFQQAGANQWNGGAVDGSELVLWWTVDREQTQTPLELALPEGAGYTATVEFDWEHSSCVAHAAGDVAQPFRDFVQASVNAKTFEAAGAPTLDPAASGVGLRANFTVRSGLEVDVSSVVARAVFLGNSTKIAATGTSATNVGVGDGLGVDAGANATAEATLPSAGLVLFPAIGWTVDGAESSRVAPGTAFSVYSSAATGSGYGRSGTLLPAALPASGGLYIVLVDVTYTPRDPTLGASTDTFAFAVVV